MPRLLNDPVDWKIDLETWDLVIPITYVRGLDAVVQAVNIRLKLWKGEWFLDRLVGIPYLETSDGLVPESAAILGQPFDEVKTRSAILKEVLTVEEVLDVPVMQLVFDGANRTLGVNLVIRTIFGDTTIDVTLDAPSG